MLIAEPVSEHFCLLYLNAANINVNPMTAIKKSTLSFLDSLAQNNEREWFHNNKASYHEAKENYEAIVTEIIAIITDFDPILKGLEVKNCMFRINRDTRFSHDKSPYKTNFGAFIVRGGKKNSDRFPGYYIHIEAGEAMIAGGAYMPPAPWLAAIREKIDEEPERFHEIINAGKFIRYFGSIQGDKLKKAPKGYPVDHPDIELLKYKSFHVMHSVPDKMLLDEQFVDYAGEVCRAMKPFNDFLAEY